MRIEDLRVGDAFEYLEGAIGGVRSPVTRTAVDGFVYVNGIAWDQETVDRVMSWNSSWRFHRQFPTHVRLPIGI